MEENQNSQYGQPIDYADDEATQVLTPDMQINAADNNSQSPEEQGYSQSTNSQQSEYGQPQPMSGPSYGQPQPMSGPSYGRPQPMGGPSYGQPQQMGGPSYGQPQPMGGPSYGRPQPMGGPNYGQPQQMGGPNYGQPQQMGGPSYGQPQQMGGPSYGRPQPVGGPNYGQAAPGNSALKGLVHNVLGLFTAPADTSVRMSQEGSALSGVVLSGVNALITFILVFVNLLIIGADAGPAIGKATYMLIFMFVANVIIAAAAYLSGGVIFKSGMSFGNAFGAVGTLAVYETVAIILGIVLETLSGLMYKADFISGITGGFAYILFLAAGIAGVIIAAHGLYGSMDVNDNKKILALIITIVMAVFVITVYDNIAQKIFNDSGTCAEQVLYYFKNSASYTSYFRW